MDGKIIKRQENELEFSAGMVDVRRIEKFNTPGIGSFGSEPNLADLRVTPVNYNLF